MRRQQPVIRSARRSGACRGGENPRRGILACQPGRKCRSMTYRFTYSLTAALAALMLLTGFSRTAFAQIAPETPSDDSPLTEREVPTIDTDLESQPLLEETDQPAVPMESRGAARRDPSAGWESIGSALRPTWG